MQRDAMQRARTPDSLCTQSKPTTSVRVKPVPVEVMCRTKHFELPPEIQAVQNDKLTSLLARYNENQKEQDAQHGRPLTSAA